MFGRRRSAAALVVAALVLGVGGDAVTGRTSRSSTSVLEFPVTFVVKNTNTSGLPCPADGASYEVRGLLAGPLSAFASDHPRAISVYLHGFSFGGKFLWSFKPVSGYDFPIEMAKLGHVSLSIDRLGYDSSPHPNGQLLCLGSGADTTHQIVQALRGGAYTVHGYSEPAPAFDKVVLVGHDTGGAIAEIEAYSYKDVDGIVVWGWAEQGFSQWVLDRFPERTAFCAGGGEGAEDGAPAGGYFHWPVSEDEVREGISKYMDPAVVDAAVPMRNRNPCGDIYSAATMAQLNGDSNTSRLDEIEVPVLLIYEDEDIIFTKDGAEAQKAHFTGTDDLTWVMLTQAGHFPMLERRAATYRELVSDWLEQRSF